LLDVYVGGTAVLTRSTFTDPGSDIKPDDFTAVVSDANGDDLTAAVTWDSTNNDFAVKISGAMEFSGDQTLTLEVDNNAVPGGASTLADIPAAVSETTPAVPQYLQATTVSAGEVDLSWSDGAGATSATVLRSQGAGSFTPLATVDAGTEAYQDASVLPNTQYRYELQSANGLGLSTVTPAASAITPIDTPANPTATPTDATHALVSWTCDSTGVSSFEIWQSTDGTNWTPIASATPWQRSIAVSGLSAGGFYLFQIVARGATASATSSPVSLGLPDPAISGPASINYGQAYVLHLNPGNPNAAVSYVTVYWGDGNTSTIADGSATATHYYSAAGDYAISAGFQVSDSVVFSAAGPTVTVAAQASAPTDLAASLNGGRVQLDWNYAGTPVLGFDVMLFGIDQTNVFSDYSWYRGSLLATLPADARTYTADLPAGHEYELDVQPMVAAATGPLQSNRVDIAVPQPAPTAVTASAVNSSDAAVTWTYDGPAPSGFQIGAYLPGGTCVGSGSVPAGCAYYAMSGLAAGANVTFKVIAEGYYDGTYSTDSALAQSSAITMPGDDSADWQTVASGITAATDGTVAWAGGTFAAGVYRVILTAGADHLPVSGWWDAMLYTVTDHTPGGGSGILNFDMDPGEDESTSVQAFVASCQPRIFTLSQAGPLGIYRANNDNDSTPLSDSVATQWTIQQNITTGVSISATSEQAFTVTRDGPANAPSLAVPLVVGGAVNPGDYELVCGGQTITDSVTIPQGDSSVNISLVQLNSQASGVVGICLQADATHHILPGQDSVCGSLYGAMTSNLSISLTPDSQKVTPGAFMGIDQGYDEGHTDAAGNPLPNCVPDYNAGPVFVPGEAGLAQLTYTIGDGTTPVYGSITIAAPSNYQVWYDNNGTYQEVPADDLSADSPGQRFDALPPGQYPGTMTFWLKAVGPNWNYSQGPFASVWAGFTSLDDTNSYPVVYDYLNVTALNLQLLWGNGATANPANSPTSPDGQDLACDPTPVDADLVQLTPVLSGWYGPVSFADVLPAGTTLTLSYTHDSNGGDVRVWGSDSTEGDPLLGVPVSDPSASAVTTVSWTVGDTSNPMPATFWVEGDVNSINPKDVVFTLSVTLPRASEQSNMYQDMEPNQAQRGQATTTPTSGPTTQASTNATSADPTAEGYVFNVDGKAIGSDLEHAAIISSVKITANNKGQPVVRVTVKEGPFYDLAAGGGANSLLNNLTGSTHPDQDSLQVVVSSKDSKGHAGTFVNTVMPPKNRRQGAIWENVPGMSSDN